MAETSSSSSSSAMAGPSSPKRARLDPLRATTPPPRGDNVSHLAMGPKNLPPTPEHVRVMQENRLKAKAKIQAQARAQYPQYHLGNQEKGKGPVQLEGKETGSKSSTPTPMLGPHGSLKGIPATSRNADHQPPQNLSANGRASPQKREINPATGRPRLPNPADRPVDPNVPLPRDQSLGDYIEFDLSKLHNSKGGFLIDDDAAMNGGLGGRRTIEEVRRERERERQRIREAMEPGIVLDDRLEICEDCGSKELNDQFKRIFGVRVCRVCERKLPEKYSLLTKTEVKEDYLLTDPELRDEDLLPHLLKANPHKSTYSNMMLFLRCQVEQYAFSTAKWGSEAGLDAEFARRQEEKSRKRGKKFMAGLQDLRKRTRDNVWQKRRDAEHRHVFVDMDPSEGQDYGDDDDDGNEAGQRQGLQKQICQGCGHVIEVEIF